MGLTAIFTYRKIQAVRDKVHCARGEEWQSCGKVARGMESPEGVLFLKGSAKTLAWKSFWCIKEAVQIV